ncbi:MAG: DedA family protein [Sphingobacteriia bacterium]|nr:DedA family protein [Sphingobacteriia bacterium]
MELILDWIQWLVNFTHSIGYLGIFIATFLESTFLPIPAELTMIPAGYLVYQGERNLTLVILTSISGTILGAGLNYYIAYVYGRKLLLKYGKYFFIDEKKLNSIEKFFNKHGAVSTFSGRLIPGVRHFISFPAGLAKMNLKKFCLYTALGGGIWMITLIVLGYYIGENEDLIAEWLPIITIFILSVCAIFVGIYTKLQTKKKDN